MAESIADMTKEELRELIETSIEQKLLELFGDPEEGQELREAIHQHLLRQKTAVGQGERGEPMENIIKRLNLD
jgi:hypothetical protein